MSDKPRTKRFIGLALGGALVALLLVIGMNYLIDPYGYFGQNLLSSLNQGKVAQNRHMRLVKARLIEETDFDRIVLGSSRAMAFAPGFTGDAREFINLALAGSGVRENLAYLRFADTVQGVAEVVYPLDFFSFHAHLREQPGYSEARLDPTKSAHFGKYLKSDLVEMLASLNATVASIDTIKANLGRRSEAPSSGPEASAFRQVEHSAFASMETTFLKELWFYPPLNDFVFAADGYDSLQTFQELCFYLAENDIQSRLFISPIHVRLQVAMLAAGLRTKYDNWVEQVTMAVDRARSRNPGWRVSLWNFSGVNSVTSEPVPQQSGPMQNYVDSSHYSGRIATVMYRTIDEGRPVIEGFGQELQPETVKEELARERAELQTFIDRHPGIWQEISQLNRRVEAARMRYGDH